MTKYITSSIFRQIQDLPNYIYKIVTILSQHPRPQCPSSPLTLPISQLYWNSSQHLPLLDINLLFCVCVKSKVKKGKGFVFIPDFGLSNYTSFILFVSITHTIILINEFVSDPELYHVTTKWIFLFFPLNLLPRLLSFQVINWII